MLTVSQIDELKSELAQFCGTESYHRCGISPMIVCTDGVRYLAEKCGAFWFLDIIQSYQSQPAFKKAESQTWTLTVAERKGVVVATNNANNRQLCRQEIERTDFPLDKATVKIESQGDGYWVMALPQED